MPRGRAVKPAVGAAAAALAVLVPPPAGAAAAGTAAPAAAAAAAAVAPVLATISSRCRGARRRSGPRRQHAAVRCLVNQARARAGLHRFHRSVTLFRAARRHAHDMVRAHFFGHQRAGGPSLFRRARNAGFRGRSIGEAIAWGCGSPATPLAVVRAWIASPPHAAILFARSLNRAGVGVAGHTPVGCAGATYVLDAGG